MHHICFSTIASGAFVAGTKAGWAYNNFPFGDSILPLLQQINRTIFRFYLMIWDSFSSFHRILASITLIIIVFTCIYLLMVTSSEIIKKLSTALFILSVILSISFRDNNFKTMYL